MTTTSRIAFAGAALALGLAATNAQAANTRTWISGKGVDQAGCGPVASPCRTLQFAHDNTVAGGEIDILDAAGYGSVAISKSINIINDGVGVAGVLTPPAGTGIAINASGSDVVVLRGLTIEGANSGGRGVAVKSVGTLEIVNCVMQQFVGSDGLGTNGLGNGIFVGPTSGNPTITISNTTTSGNDYAGLFVDVPPGSAANVKLTADRMLATHNTFGIYVRNRNNPSTAALVATVSNSVVSENTLSGVSTQGYGGQVIVNVDSTVLSNNGSGSYANGPTAKMYLGRSVATGNGTGIANNAGTLYSYKNNQIDGNTTDVSGTVTTLTLK